MVILKGGTFHLVFNVDASVAVAMNHASLSWNDKVDVAPLACECEESLNNDVPRDRIDIVSK